MLKRPFAGFTLLACVVCAGLAHAVRDQSPTTFSGSYAVYGGAPKDLEAREPTPGDAKIAFSVRGNAAKEIFDNIGPGRAAHSPAESTCPGNPAILVRERDALICRRHPREGYWCTFGFDLGTGLSTWGVVGGAMCEDIGR